jgi:predicted DNA-binding transcriptional regulator AlpA
MSRRTQIQSPPIETAPALLDTKTAAVYLGKSPSFLIKSRCVGRTIGPRFVRLGGTVCYRRSDLDAWIAGLTSYVNLAECGQ